MWRSIMCKRSRDSRGIDSREVSRMRDEKLAWNDTPFHYQGGQYARSYIILCSPLIYQKRIFNSIVERYNSAWKGYSVVNKWRGYTETMKCLENAQGRGD